MPTQQDRSSNKGLSRSLSGESAAVASSPSHSSTGRKDLSPGLHLLRVDGLGVGRPLACHPRSPPDNLDIRASGRPSLRRKAITYTSRPADMLPPAPPVLAKKTRSLAPPAPLSKSSMSVRIASRLNMIAVWARDSAPGSVPAAYSLSCRASKKRNRSPRCCFASTSSGVSHRSSSSPMPFP